MYPTLARTHAYHHPHPFQVTGRELKGVLKQIHEGVKGDVGNPMEDVTAHKPISNKGQRLICSLPVTADTEVRRRGCLGQARRSRGCSRA